MHIHLKNQNCQCCKSFAASICKCEEVHLHISWWTSPFPWPLREWGKNGKMTIWCYWEICHHWRTYYISMLCDRMDRENQWICLLFYFRAFFFKIRLDSQDASISSIGCAIAHRSLERLNTVAFYFNTFKRMTTTSLGHMLWTRGWPQSRSKDKGQ